jgi:hypothetical protein
MQEIWKNIPNYKGYYQVSNLGRVKGIERKVKQSTDCFKTIKERILKQSLGNSGYLVVNFSLNGKIKTRTVHQLVAIVFLNHKPCGLKLVIDHIDEIKTNNKLSNLRIVTNRANSSRRKDGTSRYVGVSLCKTNVKWQSTIKIKGKQINLGSFTKEYDAHLAYQNALRNL